MKHNGNLQVAGRLSTPKLIVGDFVGTTITSGSYEFPHSIGLDGSVLSVSAGQVVWDNTTFATNADTQAISANLQHQFDISLKTINSISPSGNNIDLLGSVSGNQGIEVIPLIDGKIRIQLYTPISITSFYLTGNTYWELGYILPSCQLVWSFNKPTTLQSISPIGVIPNGTTTYTYTTPINATTSFNLSGTDGTSTANGTVTEYFLPRVYWGPSTIAGLLSSSDIQTLSNSQLAFNRNLNTTTNCAGGNRIVYAYPVSYGLATVRDGNGLLFQDWSDGLGGSSTTPYIVSITNGFGYTQNYYVYQTFNYYNGTSIIFNFS